VDFSSFTYQALSEIMETSTSRLRKEGEEGYVQGVTGFLRRLRKRKNKVIKKTKPGSMNFFSITGNKMMQTEYINLRYV